MERVDSLNFNLMKFLTVPAHSPSYYKTRWTCFAIIVKFFNTLAEEKDKVAFDFDAEFEFKMDKETKKLKMKEIVYYASFRTDYATKDQYELKKECIMFLYDKDIEWGGLILIICACIGVDPLNIIREAKVPTMEDEE